MSDLSREVTEFAWNANRFACSLDRDCQEPAHATEKVLTTVYDSACNIQDCPLYMARSAPFDSLSPSDSNASDAAHVYFDSIMASQLLKDSASESSDIQSSPECIQFIEFKLPGVVDRDHNNTPVAARVWKSDYVSDWSADRVEFLELARSHPGDSVTDDFKMDLEVTQCEGGIGRGYQPLTTKAGSRLWSISFAEPGDGSGQPDPPCTCTQLRASYPMQLLVRFDRGRQAIVYEAFEFQPPLVCTFQNALAKGIAPISESELKQVESMLKRTKKQRDSMTRMLDQVRTAFGGGDDNDDSTPIYRIPTPPENLPHLERCAIYGAEALVPLVSWLRFRQSFARRVRFPVDRVIGARLVSFNYERPHADLRPAKGSVPLEKLGQPRESNEEDEDEDDEEAARVAEGPELGGGFMEGVSHAEVGPLAMLVLELSGTGEEVGCSYAAMRLWPASKLERKRHSCEDWTPSGACSRSTRHYIVGDLCELRELASYLCEVSPHMKSLLLPQDAEGGEKQAKLQKTSAFMNVAQSSINSLSGPLSILHPRATKRVPSLSVLAARVAAASSSSSAAAGTGCGSKESGNPLNTVDAVNEFLERCGIEDVSDVNSCVKAGLLNGHIKVPPELLNAPDASAFLDTVLLETNCSDCDESHEIVCTVRDALEQDSWEGLERYNCYDDGVFISGLCEGEPSIEIRKYHNHCEACPGFGRCIGDSRNDHCHRCGGHYFAGSTGRFGCPCRGGRDEDEDEDGDGDGDSDDESEDFFDDLEEQRRDEAIIPAHPDASCWSGHLPDIESYKWPADATASDDSDSDEVE